MLLAAVGFYILGQYVGLYKMQAHVAVWKGFPAKSYTFDLMSCDEKVEYFEERESLRARRAASDYLLYLAHWSSKFPDVTDIDRSSDNMFKNRASVEQ